MPEVRRASQYFDPKIVQFGTIDCTLHSQLCANEGIRSYPTVMLYNGSDIHYFHGVPDENGLVNFVDHILNRVGKYVMLRPLKTVRNSNRSHDFKVSE